MLAIKYIEDETIIDKILSRQTTIALGSKITSKQSKKDPCFKNNLHHNAEHIKYSWNMQIKRIITHAERSNLVATDKPRNLLIDIEVALLHLINKLYWLNNFIVFYLKKLLVIKYNFYCRQTNISKKIKIIHILLLDISLISLEYSRKAYMRIQQHLIKNQYFYKAQMFSEAELHTLASAIAEVFKNNQEKLTINWIQDRFGINSFRQARYIYNLIA